MTRYEKVIADTNKPNINIYVGQKLKFKELNANNRNKTVTGIYPVLQIYKYFFVIQKANYRESYRYDEKVYVEV